ncbi:NAD(P)H-dependent oxidoreductase [Desulfococcus sp.]|uniref:NAD(P)H-dependent oxidoreductase n=1 Tax=Desulfococcus sp. TaxID=2025834 RepID=UPI0035941066
MIIVDKALEKRQAENRPVRVGMIGAGFMGRGIALQIQRYVKGMELVAIANRHLDGAIKAFQGASVETPAVAETQGDLESIISKGGHGVTEDALMLCRAGNIDVVIEVTGAVEFGAHVAMTAIQNGKHVVLMNAELDGTIGPVLKVHADRAGVVVTNADGDQPGVTMNLYRFVKSIGVKPVLCGNIKGLHDPYRNPTTQEGFAKKWGQKPHMVTSFADGTKVSFEQAIIANATGMRVAKRGMFGPTVAAGTHIRQAVDAYPVEEVLHGPGIVDYVVGAEPGPGIFVLGTHDNPVQQHYLNLYKLGEGPLYCFYTPYHLCHFEVPLTVARAAIFHDAAISPMGRPCVDVVAAAKIDLKKGQTLDGLGHYMTYGLCENSDTVIRENLLPIGLAEGCTVKRDLSRDQVLTCDDVEFPAGRLCDQLRREQDGLFFKPILENRP